ncbi:MAG: hypothetical protein ACTSRZ_16250 [Promethearchaeota archaeon]
MNQTKIQYDDLKVPEDELDKEWAKDWKTITELYKLTEKLKDLFNELDVGYLRKLTQDSLVLNLKKYIWSLKGYLIEKYGEDFIDYFEDMPSL